MTDVSDPSAKTLSIQDARLEAWNQCVGPLTISSYTISLCLTIDSSGNTIYLTLALTLNGTQYKWIQSIDGNISYSCAVCTGLSLGVFITQWNLQQQLLSCTVTVKAYIWGVPVTLYSQAVTVNLTSLDETELAALNTAQLSSFGELNQFLGLLAQVRSSSNTALSEMP